jgi:hypothetical protein
MKFLQIFLVMREENFLKEVFPRTPFQELLSAQNSVLGKGKEEAIPPLARGYAENFLKKVPRTPQKL